MNKKKLPKAIRQTTADMGEVGAIVDASGHTMEPTLPAHLHDLGVALEARTAVDALGAVQSWKSAATTAEETTSPAPITTIIDNRRARAMKLVKRFSLWSGAAGFIPLPFVDVAAVGGIQIQMIRRISQIYGVPFSENRGKALIASLAGSMIPGSSVIGAASALKSVPAIGTAVGTVAMPALSAGATYAIGTAFIQHFASGGTLLDFNPQTFALST